MQRVARSQLLRLLLTSVWLTAATVAAPKPHIITFGKWTSVQWLSGTDESKPLTLKVRPLFVDARLKEYIVGFTHDVTDRLFVVRRVFRVNDSLPLDTGSPRWQWQRGGWLLVDRVTGHISPINLPDFDNYYSPASWYRDYVAYCAVSDDGKRLYATVAQLGRRKPVLKKTLSNEGIANQAPDSACQAPTWQRTPVRVTFEPATGAKQTFAIRGHVVDSVIDNDTEETGDEEASK